MISQYLTLVFDGKCSSDFGLSCCNGTNNNGLYQDTFVANKSINEDMVSDRPRPYFKSVTKEPITIPLILAPTNYHPFTQEQLQLVKQWLNKDTYSEFYFKEYPIRHYFGIMIDNSTMNHNGLGEGYFSIQIRCDAPNAYSPEISVYNNIPSDGEYVMLENKGDEILRPYIQFTKIGDGSLSIMNLTNGGKQCIINNLKDGETITLDNENEMIESDLDNVYHYDDHNNIFVECPVGRNRLFINGECKMKIYYRYIYD